MSKKLDSEPYTEISYKGLGIDTINLLSHLRVVDNLSCPAPGAGSRNQCPNLYTGRFHL